MTYVYPVDEQFAERMTQACDNCDKIPSLHNGRLVELSKQLSYIGVSATKETVRKWLLGQARPRKAKMTALAKVLNVDEAWLSIGVRPDKTDDQKRLLPKVSEASVLYFASLIGFQGMPVAFPEEENDDYHFIAIIGARQRKFYVSSGQVDNSNVTFYFPNNSHGISLVGIIQGHKNIHSVYEFEQSNIEKHAIKKAGYAEITMGIDDNGILNSESYQVGKSDTYNA